MPAQSQSQQEEIKTHDGYATLHAYTHRISGSIRQGTWLGTVNSKGIFVFSTKICSKSVAVFVLGAGSNAHQEFDDTQEEQYAESFAKR